MIDVGRQRYRALLILVVLFGLNMVVQAAEPNEVIVWENSGFQGQHYSWTMEQDLRHRLVPHFAQLPEWLNDGISSIEVGSKVKVITYRHGDFAGPSKIYEGEISSLSNYWNDEISSLIIFPRNLVGPLGVVLSDTAFNTVTGYEPNHQFFPLPEYLKDKEELYPGLDDYMNDKAEYVLIQGDHIEVELSRHADFQGSKYTDNLLLPTGACGSQAVGNWNNYQTFRLRGCVLNLEQEVSSLKVRETGPVEEQSYVTATSAGPTSHRAPPATSAIEAPKVVQTLPDISALIQPASPKESASPLESISRLSGRVYVGEVGLESSPLRGVSLELYCSNDLGSQGRKVDATSTSSDGWYELTVPSGCEFYNIRMIPSSGYSMEGASSVAGRVIDNNTIQYAYPLKDLVLTGNKFWVKPTTPTAPFKPVEPIQPSEPPAEQPRCLGGCECMSQEMAEQEFGRYERCSPEICGYDQDRNPLYCFKPIAEPSPEQPLSLADLTVELYSYQVQTAPEHKGIFPWPPLTDRPTLFQVLVKNVGTAPVNESFTVEFYVDDKRECSWTFSPISAEEDLLHQFSPLMPGGTRIYNCERMFQEGEKSLRWVVDTGNEISESNESNNDLIKIAKWQGAPDLIVEDVWPDGKPTGGQKSTWNVKIKNVGQGDVSVPFLTTFWPEGIAGGTQENFWSQSLPVGQSISWNTTQPFRSWGKLNITVTADASYAITEGLPNGEDNNELVKQFDLAFVDLKVENLTITPKKLVENGKTTISFTLKNVGTANAFQPFKVKLFPGKLSAGLTQPVLLTVKELKAGQSINMEHDIKLLPGDYQVAVEADHPDPNNVYFEPDRNNNVAVKPVHVYSQKEVFLISDLNWKEVLKLVPLSTWRDQNCPGGVCKYSALIFHLENDDAFDADSIIRFLQQYNPHRVSIFGNTSAIQIPIMPIPGVNPQTLESLLVAKKSAGAQLQTAQISKYDPGSYLYFWANIDKVVISEDDYETGLMASVLASYLNAPLLFDDEQLDPSIFDSREVYVVGKIQQITKQEISNRSRPVSEKNEYSLEELQKAYAIWTGTNKVILVNPADLSIGANKNFKPDKSPEISTLYTGHSLAAPFLAAAKNEVIISTMATTYLGVDSYVENTLEKLKLQGPLTYLTIVANPRAIPMARENRDTFPALWGDRVVLEEIDPSKIDSKPLKLVVITFDTSKGSVSSQDITGISSYPLSPAIYKDTVVWQDYRHGDAEIYVYNLSIKSESRVTSNASAQTNPAIFGDKIVWQDNRNKHKYKDKDGKDKETRQWDIYMYDLALKKETRITTDTHDQINPAIFGDKIVWQDKRNNDQWDIYMYDISTKTESIITSDTYAQINPTISEKYIAWQDKRNNNQWDIYIYDLVDRKELRITTNPCDQVFPSISENRIVWDDRRQGIPHVFIYDLSSMTETQLATGDNKQIRPIIHGDHIIWYSEGKTSIPPVHVAPPAGSSGGRWLTYFYDISNGKSLFHQNLLTHEFSTFRQEVDGRYYGSSVNYGKQDRAVGRIFGVSTSDVSAYIARDLFFDDIKPQKKEALLIVREDHQKETSGHETDGLTLYNYATSNYWMGDVPKQFDDVHFYAGADTGAEQAPAVNMNIPEVQGLYDDCYLILYSDHGGSQGFGNVVNSGVLRTNDATLLPSIILDIACATCTPTWGYDPEWGPRSDEGVTFCMENIRRGAMVYMGAVDLSYWHRMFDNILKGAFVDGKTIGEIYLEARNEEYTNCAAGQPPWPCGDTYYALIADPTFKPRWW